MGVQVIHKEGMYEKLFSLEQICGAIERPHEQVCPICGAEMLLRESDAGGVYWRCINEDFSRNATQPYPMDGLLRCKCGAPYVFSMKNQPQWVCSENNPLASKLKGEKCVLLSLFLI